jgi:hypothetical protein
LGLKFFIFSTFYDVFQEKISFLIRTIFQKLKKKETQQIKKNAFPTILTHFAIPKLPEALPTLKNN